MNNLFVASSGLNPWAPIKRERLVKIETCLRELYPKKFFLHQFGRDTVASDMHVVKRLLLNSQRYENISALAEIGDVLKFCRSNMPVLWKQLTQQLGNSRNYEATLYEAFVARGLSKSGLSYENNHVINGTPLDGHITYRGDSFVVECKKLFAPKLDEFNQLERGLSTILASTVDRPIFGPYVLEVLFGRPMEGRAIQILNELLGEAYSTFVGNAQSFATTYEISRQHVTLRIIPHSILHVPAESDAKQLVLRWDITSGPTFKQDGQATINLSGGFNYSNAEVIDKLRDALSQARKQHKKLVGSRLIIFVDSQELGDGQLGVLHQNEMLLRDDVIPRIRDVVKDDIVIVTRRTYDLSKARFKFYSFNDAKYQPLLERIKRGFAPQRN